MPVKGGNIVLYSEHAHASTYWYRLFPLVHAPISLLFGLGLVFSSHFVPIQTFLACMLLFTATAAHMRRRSGVKALLYRAGRFTHCQHTFMHLLTYSSVPGSVSVDLDRTNLYTSCKTQTRERTTHSQSFRQIERHAG